MPVNGVRLRKLKLHRSYDVSELAALLGVHKNTVREWQRHGLAPIDDRRPVLFSGDVVQAFLKKRIEVRKSPCPPGTFYCFGCHAPRAPALGMVDFIPINNAVTGNARALCAVCEVVMHRRVRRERLRQTFPDCAFQVLEAHPRVRQRFRPSLNLHFKTEENTG